MKVLLLKDVYKLGRAGDVKKVADGFGRNFLLPQGLAVLASVGALKQIEQIKSKAAIARAALNQEMSGFSDQLNGVTFAFNSKAGETGKLYGSITTSMIVDAINNKYGTHLERHQVEVQPIRTLGEHKVRVRLTVDLTPTVTVIVYREGEKSSMPTQTTPEVPAVAQVASESSTETSTPVEP
jgi:large subunit ribosomal protein L9